MISALAHLFLLGRCMGGLTNIPLKFTSEVKIWIRSQLFPNQWK